MFWSRIQVSHQIFRLDVGFKQERIFYHTHYLHSEKHNNVYKKVLMPFVMMEKIIVDANNWVKHM